MNGIDKPTVPVDIEVEMKRSFLDYSMSVIISRALPDVRDGLKPVHRRILYSMSDLSLSPTRPYRKCAYICGYVSGNYHPHGDAVVYPALVRLAQDFSLRYPLVDGQGNFGSVDGDPPAAMRYTESRMTRLTEEMLRDIDKETVDYDPNYDGSRTEPHVLPSAIPNLVVNGSSGIAVGMATNIPPHNLKEAINALCAMIKNPEITDKEIMKHITGPDFPTGGFICGREGIRNAYTTGRGSIIMRARVMKEIQKRTDRESIVVTEIPYQVNKATLIEKIAELVKEKKLEGISDLRDESDREGMRIVIELKKDAVADVVINALYKHTQMQTSFGVILLSIVNNQPKILTLREMLRYYLDHRLEVVTRRCLFDLRKAEERHHILLGLQIALDHLDEVITLIRKAANPPEAKTGLMKKFGLSDLQAQAILDMRLQRLTGLERQKIADEFKEVTARIAELKGILADEKKIYAIIDKELKEVRDAYGDERRTEIIEAVGDFNIEDLIVEEDMVVTVSHTGYIKRNPLSLYRAQRRGGKGKTGMSTKEEDFVADLFVASTHSNILFFTNFGKVYSLKVYEVPQAGRAAKGKALVNLLSLAENEGVTEILPVREFEDNRFVFMATRQGTVKKTELQAFANIRQTGIIAINLDEGDRLISASITDGNQEIFLSSAGGKSIRFNESGVRPMGRATRGVKGMGLAEGDVLVGMEVLSETATIMTVSENGYGKRSPMEEYRRQSRGGKGIITLRTSQRNGQVIGVFQVTEDDELMLITSSGKVLRLKVNSIRTIGRNTQGVKLIGLSPDEKVTGIARLAEKEEEEEGKEPGPEDKEIKVKKASKEITDEEAEEEEIDESGEEEESDEE